MDDRVIYLLLTLIVSASGFYNRTYQEDFHRTVQNPDLPSNYVQLATATQTGCGSREQCVLSCVMVQKCQAIVYEGTDCLLYYTSLVNISQSDQADNGIEYTESICAYTAFNRPSYCPPVPPPPPTSKDCQELHDNGITTAGVYTLQPEGYDSFDAWCDFDATNGWTVIQRRQDSEDFYLYWADYKAGFGNLEGSYWLGNDNIHALTQTNQKMNIFFRRFDGGEASANYSTFTVNDESDLYRITISGYSGNADDAMAGGTGHSHSNMYFSTRDSDNDGSGSHCASSLKGGWWYNNCRHSNLNGIYCGSGTSSNDCVLWLGSFAGSSTSLTNVIMRVSRD